MCRTTADGDFARAECAKLAPTVGLRLSEKPGKCQLLDGEILQAERECVEVLGAHFGHPDAIENELRSAVAKMEGAVQRLRRWYRAGHAHGALAVLRVCQLPSMSHVARCQVPSTARAPLEAFATMVLATLGDFVDEPALSKEQIILATLPTSFGGLGFQQLMAYLHFLPYAASVVLALAVLRERGIDLDSERVTEATPIITLGGKTCLGRPA